MADTIRTRAALQSLLADNVAGNISAQDIRDFLVSTYNWVNATIGGNIYYTEGFVGIGTATPSVRLDIRHANVTTTEFKTGIEGGTDIFSMEYVNSSPYGVRLEGGNNRAIILQATSTGYVGIKNTNPLEALDVTGNIKASGFLDVAGDSVRIRTSQTPASNGAGAQGEIAWDANYLYIATATNTWKRCALTGGY